jgi:hypothetical protein
VIGQLITDIIQRYEFVMIYLNLYSRGILMAAVITTFPWIHVAQAIPLKTYAPMISMDPNLELAKLENKYVLVTHISASTLALFRLYRMR